MRLRAHFDALAARGLAIQAEARLVASLVAPGGSVLDAGCGTDASPSDWPNWATRVGVDLDASMLAEAPPRAHPTWTGSWPTWRTSIPQRAV